MASYERELMSATAETPAQLHSGLEARARELRALLIEQTSGLRQLVQQRGQVLIERTREVMQTHPTQAVVGILLAAYVTGKLLRGRPGH